MPTLTCAHPNGSVALYYHAAGDASASRGAPVVLVHGFACGHDDWRHQAAGLAARHPVVSVDLAGHGRSTRAPGPLRVEQLGEDVAHLVRALDLRGACLVGHSMGCRVVMQALRSAPDRVGGLVLVDGSWIGRGDPERLEADTRAAVAAAGYAATVERLFEQMFLPGAESADEAPIIARAQALEPAAGTALFASLVAWDARHTEAVLREVAVPLLVIQSTYLDAERQRVPLAPGQSTPWLDLVRATAPGARIEILTGLGHFPMLEAPERVNALIEGFLAGLGPGGEQP